MGRTMKVNARISSTPEYLRKDSKEDFGRELKDGVEKIEAGDESGIKVLKEIVNSPKYNGRHKGQAIQILGYAGGKAVPILEQFLKSENWYIRENAIAALGNTRHKLALPMLESFLNDDDLWIKSTAIIALGYLGFYSATPKIEEILKESLSIYETLKHKEVMAQIEKKGTITTAEEEFHYEIETIIEDSIKTLGKIGDAGTVPFLREVLKKFDKNDPFRRDDIVLALGKLGDSSVIQELKEMHRRTEDNPLGVKKLIEGILLMMSDGIDEV